MLYPRIESSFVTATNVRLSRVVRVANRSRESFLMPTKNVTRNETKRNETQEVQEGETEVEPVVEQARVTRKEKKKKKTCNGRRVFSISPAD